MVDLEGLAHHRGSSFGGLGLPAQPSTEHYENKLAEVLDRLRRSQARSIWLEAESVQVGRCRIPAGLFQQMRQAPMLEIQRSLDERVQHLVEVYGSQGQQALSEATQRISRRLTAHGNRLKAVRTGEPVGPRSLLRPLFNDHHNADDISGLSPPADHLIQRGDIRLDPPSD